MHRSTFSSSYPVFVRTANFEVKDENFTKRPDRKGLQLREGWDAYVVRTSIAT